MLQRDRKNGIISGVCAGLGKWLGVDPVLVRVVFLICVMVYGFGILPYILLWLLMPAGD